MSNTECLTDFQKKKALGGMVSSVQGPDGRADVKRDAPGRTSGRMIWTTSGGSISGHEGRRRECLPLRPGTYRPDRGRCDCRPRYWRPCS